MRRKLFRLVCLIGLTSLAGACGAGEPKTDAERLARGRETIERMSAKLGSAEAFSMTTRESRDEAKANGQVQHLTLTRETVVRRKPDRIYSKTAGDQQREAWYDGVGMTVVLHNDNVFGQARMPETIDKTLDAMHERYGVALPVADFLYRSPSKALLSATTTGGWVGRETLDGQPAVGRRGAVVKGEGGYAAVGRHGAVVAGEEGYAAVGRRGVVVGNRYESYEGYYTRVMSGGAIVYQVVGPPVGIVIATLPVGCRSVRVGAVTYSQCGATYYQRASTGYRVVVLH